MEAEQKSNISYVYIPFCIRKGNIQTFKNSFSRSGRWKSEDDDLKYLFRFVANKVDGSDNNNRCWHYGLQNDPLGIIGKTLTGNSGSDSIIDQYWRGKFLLTIESMEVYMFSTCVGMFVFCVTLGTDDTWGIINSRYNLKYVSKTEYILADEPEKSDGQAPFTLMELAKKEMSIVCGDLKTDFFYYVYKNSLRYETAFILSYIYKTSDDDYSREMHYLRKNLGMNFNLTEKDRYDEKELLTISENIRWGISDQSAVCLGIHRDGEQFVENVLINNFCNGYKYMFVFLLHQKYTMYYFLTQIDTELRSSLNMLTDYRRRLSLFKTYFMFTRISETVQYQALYEKVQDVFDLNRIYKDVEEPLSLIADMVQKKDEERRLKEEKQKEKEDKNDAKRNDTLNILLTMMTLLTMFSAMTDAFDLGQKFYEFYKSFWDPENGPGVFNLPIVLDLIVLIVSLYVIFNASRIIFEHVNSKRRAKMKAEDILYTAVFVENDALNYAVMGIDRHVLENDIKFKHVTVEYKPKKNVFSQFLGEDVVIRIVGYGCDGKNEGLQVELDTKNEKLQKTLKKIEVPHITLSISSDSKAKFTSQIDFTKITEPIEIEGKFGVMTKNSERITE